MDYEIEAVLDILAPYFGFGDGTTRRVPIFTWLEDEWEPTEEELHRMAKDIVMAVRRASGP